MTTTDKNAIRNLANLATAVIRGELKVTSKDRSDIALALVVGADALAAADLPILADYARSRASEILR